MNDRPKPIAPPMPMVRKHNRKKRIVRKHEPDRLDVAIMTELKKYPPSTMRQIGLVIKRTHVTVKQRYNWLELHGFIKQAENAPKGSARSKILTEKGFEYLQDVSNF